MFDYKKWKQREWLMLVGGVAAAGAVVYWWSSLKKVPSEAEAEAKALEKRIEGFTNLAAGSMGNVGTMESPAYTHSVAPDCQANAVNFADLVQDGKDFTANYVKSTEGHGDRLRPSERLERVQGTDLLPRMSANVSPMNVDAASLTVHQYMVSAPRISHIKPWAKHGFGLAEAIRGHAPPIKKHPNVCLVGKTHQGRDHHRHGYFDPHFQAKYNAYNGHPYRHHKVTVAGAGCGAGNQGGVIMS